MVKRAIIIKDDFIVHQEMEYIYNSEDITVNCNAILMAFMASRREEIEGGVLYTSGCPGMLAAGMIVTAKLKKVVFDREPLSSDEMCALELLKENNIETIYNPNIIM